MYSVATRQIHFIKNLVAYLCFYADKNFSLRKCDREVAEFWYYRVFQKKTAQKSTYDKFGTVHRKSEDFAPKCSTEIMSTSQCKIYVNGLNILC